MQEVRQTPAARRSPAARPKAAEPDVRQQRHLQDYQRALELMQDEKYDKARTLFDKLLADAPPELVERVRVYQTVCERRTAQPALAFATTEEQYDYAVSLLNSGNFEDARDQFESLLSANPEIDFAHYGMALLNSMTGQNEEALEHLTRAIALNPSLRLQARTDPDFIDMIDDPRFTELLYPEVG